MSFIVSPGSIQAPFTAGGIAYGNGTIAKITSAGTTGQSLLSAGAGVPTWGSPASAVTATTATNLAAGAAGQVPYQSGAGATAFTAVGTAGQLLQSNGAGAPTWVNAAAGAVTLISTGSWSNVFSYTVTRGFSTTYKLYLLVFQILYNFNQTSTIGPYLQFYANGSVDVNNAYSQTTSQLAPTYAATGYISADRLFLGRNLGGRFNYRASSYNVWLDASQIATANTFRLGGYSLGSYFDETTNSPMEASSMWYLGNLGRNSTPTGFVISAGSAFVGTYYLYGYSPV